jgi:hypothetical protein
MTDTDTVVIAILAKDKAHCLPAYLHCLEKQTWPKQRTHVYIRTNNNTDFTAEILRHWSKTHSGEYLSVYLDDSDVDEPVHTFAPHEWNAMRFKVLGRIRQESVKYAEKLGAHYFVADCDNFIRPYVLETLVKTGLPVVGPLLITGKTRYSNYHNVCDARGYFAENPAYDFILERKIKGLIEVDVVHCTYLIRNSVLPLVKYVDDSARHEYVIFSATLRLSRTPQFIDNRCIGGHITFADSRADLDSEPWYRMYEPIPSDASSRVPCQH